MPEPVEPTADPTPATEAKETPAAETPKTEEAPREITSFEDLNSEEYETYMAKGELPTKPTKEEEPAPSTEPKKKAESEAETKEAESEPGKETQQESKKGKNAETRIAQLDSQVQEKLKQRAQARDEVEQLERRKAQLKEDLAKPADPPPAATKTPDPQEPKEDDYENYTDFLDARADFRVEKKLAEEREKDRIARQREEAEKRNRESAEKLSKNVAAARKRIPDIGKSLEAAQQGLIPLNKAMEKVVMQTEYGPDVLHALWLDRDNAARIAGLDEILTHRELLQIEESLKAPKTKTVTTASPPPKEISGKNTAAPDEAAAAVEAGDYESYEATMNAKDAARLVR